MRLSSYVAQAGVASRRKAAALIKEGRVFVNGKRCEQPWYVVQEDDAVTVDGRTLRKQKKVYILLNKPEGYVSTRVDQRGRKTVLELIKPNIKERLYPVGRLDCGTTGLLVVTNDGDMTQKLAHPRYGVQKVYKVTLDAPVSYEDIKKIRSGVDLSDGTVTVDEVSYCSKQRKCVSVTLHSGKYRVVRRLFARLGYHVQKLDRVRYAFLTKKGLPIGRWRFLTQREVAALKAVGTSIDINTQEKAGKLHDK